MSNNGIKTEEEIIKYINNKTYLEKMNDNMKKFISGIFDFDLKNTKIKAYKYVENYKPDIIVTANGISKYISIKTGENNSVHQEHIYSFVNFLKCNYLNENDQKSLLLFHFNDGTTNGSGKTRHNANDFLVSEQEKIQKINEYFNKDEFAKIAIERILFKGEYFHLPLVDYIYYGNIYEGYWAKREEIIDYLISKKFYSGTIHISKLYYQSLHRNLKYDKYREYRRYYVQFKWYSIKEDLKYIMNTKLKK